MVRRVLRQNYTLSSNGIPGNDDCGEMSSWAVLSMMGLYTVDPASGAYELCSPVFPKISIHLLPMHSTVKLHALNIRRERRFGGGGNNKAAAGVGGVGGVY